MDPSLIKQGDTESFEQFVLYYRKKAELFALNIVKDRHLSEEIVQDSFVKLYVYRDRIDESKSLKAYFFSIVHNRAIDTIKKNKKESLKATNFLRKPCVSQAFRRNFRLIF